MKNLKIRMAAAIYAAQQHATEVMAHKRRGQFAADHGIAIAITVALGGLALVLAFALLKDTIGPELKKAIVGFFNFG